MQLQDETQLCLGAWTDLYNAAQAKYECNNTLACPPCCVLVTLSAYEGVKIDGDILWRHCMATVVTDPLNNMIPSIHKQQSTREI